MIVDSLEAILGFKFEGAGLKQFENGMRSASMKLADFSDRVTRAAAGMTLAAGAITTGLGAALGKSVIDASAQWETYTATLKTIEGSSEAAEKSLAWVADFAKRTPYDMNQVTEAFIAMKAYGLDPMNGSLETLGDAASGMNKTLMDAVEAIADAVTGENERLKSFGIRTSVAGDEVTYSWRENGKDLTKTVRKNGTEIEKALLDILGRFDGAMLEQSTTWKGMFAALGDNYDDFLRRIGRGGFFDSVKRGLKEILDTIGEMDRNGTLDMWSRRLGIAFTWATEQAKSFARRIGGHIETISGFFEGRFGAIGDNLEPIAKALGLLMLRLFPVTGAFLALGLAVEDWLSYMAGAPSKIGDLIKALADFLGTDPDKVATALAGIAQAAGWFATAALGVTLFAGALRSLSGALVLLKGAQWATTFLASLAGIQWGAATAGAGAAAASAGAAAGGGAAATAGRAGGSAVVAAGAVRTLGPAAGLAAVGGAALFYGDKIVQAINERVKEIGADPKWAAERTAPIANNGIGQSGHYNYNVGMGDFSAYDKRMQGGGADWSGIMSGAQSALQAVMQMTGLQPQLDAAKAVMNDLARSHRASLELDLSAFNSAIDHAQSRLNSLQGIANARAGSLRGLPPAREIGAGASP